MHMQVTQRDTSCPNGGIFYSCNAGFVGCCLVEACNPGVGCPADKDRTPDNSSTRGPLTTKTESTRSAAVTSAPSTVSSIIASTTLLGSLIPISGVSSTLAMTPTTTPEIKQEYTAGHGAPTAAIVGGILGGIILIAIIIAMVFCIRRKKHAKVYKAAGYPSRYVGSDMSPHLPNYQESKTLKFAGLLGRKSKLAHHVGNRRSVLAAEMEETVPKHILYAELPANPGVVRDV